MKVLFLDCFSGISGDMTVGALCDLGVNPSTFEWELAKVEIGDFHMHFERGQRQNVTGVKFGIHGGAVHTHDQDEEADEPGQVHDHAHEHHHEHDEHTHEHEQAQPHGEHAHGHGDEHAHEHGHGDEHDHGEAEHHDHGHTHEHGDGEHHEHEHAHTHEHEHGRTYAEVRGLIEASDLSDFVKKHALSIFQRVAVAEAKIHGTSVEAIGFHEVGALDSIADIICACVGIELLGVEKVFVSSLADGKGWVDCAHGRFPIPAMATLEILRGIPVGQIDEPFEFITPTGAAIAAEFGESFGVMPTMKVEKIGYGLGSRKLASRPNVLRAVIGELVEGSGESKQGGYGADTVTQIETNIDDLSPEITGALLDRLLAAGALDAFFTPVQMKKNRPGVLLTVLCEPEKGEAVSGLIFRETSSFGVRLSEKRRLKLERRIETVQTAYGDIQIKLGFDLEGKPLQVSPEFEACRAVADRTGEPLRVVYEAALRAYQAPSEKAGSATHPRG